MATSVAESTATSVKDGSESSGSEIEEALPGEDVIVLHPGSRHLLLVSRPRLLHGTLCGETRWALGWHLVLQRPLGILIMTPHPPFPATQGLASHALPVSMPNVIAWLTREPEPETQPEQQDPEQPQRQRQGQQESPVAADHPQSQQEENGPGNDGKPGVVSGGEDPANAQQPPASSRSNPPSAPVALAGSDDKRALHETTRSEVERAARALGMVGPRGRGFPAASTLRTFNSQSQPQRIPAHNDAGLREWTDVSGRPTFVVGEAAMAVPPEAPYKLHWPFHGDNLAPAEARSRTASMADVEHIWRTAIEQKLQVNRSAFVSYKLLVVLPDTVSRKLVKEIVTMALGSLGFGFVCIHQSSVCASFGAGLAAAVVVDVGHSSCSISCVEDGVSVPASRVNLRYGGEHIGRESPWRSSAPSASASSSAGPLLILRWPSANPSMALWLTPCVPAGCGGFAFRRSHVDAEGPRFPVQGPRYGQPPGPRLLARAAGGPLPP